MASPHTWANSVRIRFEQENPKKSGGASRERYEKYKVATTIGQAWALGVWKGDLINDFERGYLKKLGRSAGGDMPSKPGCGVKRKAPSDADVVVGKKRKHAGIRRVASGPRAAPKKRNNLRRVRDLAAEERTKFAENIKQDAENGKRKVAPSGAAMKGKKKKVSFRKVRELAIAEKRTFAENSKQDGRNKKDGCKETTLGACAKKVATSEKKLGTSAKKKLAASEKKLDASAEKSTKVVKEQPSSDSKATQVTVVKASLHTEGVTKAEKPKAVKVAAPKVESKMSEKAEAKKAEPKKEAEKESTDGTDDVAMGTRRDVPLPPDHGCAELWADMQRAGWRFCEFQYMRGVRRGMPYHRFCKPSGGSINNGLDQAIEIYAKAEGLDLEELLKKSGRKEILEKTALKKKLTAEERTLSIEAYREAHGRVTGLPEGWTMERSGQRLVMLSPDGVRCCLYTDIEAYFGSRMIGLRGKQQGAQQLD